MRATSLGHAGILIETDQASIVCDPWFVPAFFGSWFVFPRNDRLPAELMAKVEQPDFLYVSHLHGDHLDEAFLADHIDRATTVLLPGYPTGELERTLRELGFARFVPTEHATPVEIAPGLTVEIHVETSITDGPGGDSAIIVDDGSSRLLNQNDCRLHDLAALTAHGPIDQQWLQYSGAIWYPMVYEMPEEHLRELVHAKVESQFARAVRYVQAVRPQVVVPSAGPPCFLDPELFGFNVITGDELSIFPDATAFVERLREEGIDTARIVIPGSAVTTTGDGTVTVEHPLPDDEVERIFTDKKAYLEEYAADWQPWLEAQRATWHEPTPDLLDTLQDWWEPLLAMAPTLRAAVGANALLRLGDLDVLIDFPAGLVRAWAGEPYDFSFTIDRRLVETVVAQRAVDWSNALFLSCRFRAWRAGEFNEFLYNFFKSLSAERMERTEAEARAKRHEVSADSEVEEVRLDRWIVERYCPHRRADLATFGRVDGCVLTCELHGWQFDLETGRCLTADDRSIRVRPADRRPVPTVRRRRPTSAGTCTTGPAAPRCPSRRAPRPWSPSASSRSPRWRP
jgi:UDP-MurNAc hydroxylase